MNTKEIAGLHTPATEMNVRNLTEQHLAQHNLIKKRRLKGHKCTSVAWFIVDDAVSAYTNLYS